MAIRDEWSITCRDVIGRRQVLTVFIEGGQVVLVPPPGEATVLAPLDAGRLRAALRDALLSLDLPRHRHRR
ncbi:hypothetical protein ORV05_04500 [Amycolatopsis cynarae]|uniref:Uncharacterized protein n=1 Tax=Amycolatopsis cynarae TaxID=2995223 RepID=A0ABY7B408_9PSEU|nr:hypothetical protein [Amycolatopsis sp. HUAS 11-8]WAL67054.1 hypothetical protein ORV05_04500 [Amycolatopsis sp. HUAS 11-8]